MPAAVAGRLTLPLEVRPVSSRADETAFLRIPAALGGEAAGWSVPLEFDTRRFFDPRRNGVLRDHAAARFLAWRDGRCAGRIAAGRQREAAPDGIGTFGFLALERDPATLTALLRAVGGWLSAQGARRLRGPLSLTINHEAGALVEGFGRPGMVRMPRTPEWLPAMLEGAGLAPERDVLACTLTVTEERHRARFAALLALWPGAADLRVRPLDPRHFADEIRLVTALYNDAWADNWGAVSVAEAATIARVMRPLLRAGAILFAEWRGEPMGVLSLVPNLDEATEGLGGRLLPFGWWRVARVLGGAGDRRASPCSARSAASGTIPSRPWRPARCWTAPSASPPHAGGRRWKSLGYWATTRRCSARWRGCPRR
jgi:hypothetical protein